MDMKPVLLIILILVISCSPKQEPLPFYNTADFTPQWIEPGAVEYQSIHKIPDFKFINQDGDTITQASMAGKIVVADFFFTICPGICPRLTASMGNIQDAFKEDGTVMLLSHSVTPDMDNVSRLKVYADTHHVSSGKWHLLTGNREAIYHIARHGYFADEETGLAKGENEFLHTENFILIDGHQRIRGVYNGTNPAEVERLIEDIRTLRKENIS